MGREDELEESIAVGSRGTLLFLMGKEMEILQARRSCSVAYENLSYKNRQKIPYTSTKEPNIALHVGNAAVSSGSSPKISSGRNSPSASIVSSLWSDLKSLLLRSPDSVYHGPLPFDYSALHAHCPLLHHTNAAPLFCTELEIVQDSGAGFSCAASDHQPQALPPLATDPLHTPLSPQRTNYSKYKMAPSHSPSSSKVFQPAERSPAFLHYSPSTQNSSIVAYPKEKTVATGLHAAIPQIRASQLPGDGCLSDYSHGRSAFHNHSRERLVAEAACHDPNGKPALHSCPSEQKLQKPSLAGSAVDASDPSLRYPMYPKTKLVMEVVYEMRRRQEKFPTSRRDVDSQNGEISQEGSASGSKATASRKSHTKKREDKTMLCRRMQYEYCNQKIREQKGRLPSDDQYPSMRKRGERGRLQADAEDSSMHMGKDGGSYMIKEDDECCMAKKPILLESAELEKGSAWTVPATSNPLISMTPCSKASRSLGDRELPQLNVSVVDLQCCRTPLHHSSSRRLSFTRLSSY